MRTTQQIFLLKTDFFMWFFFSLILCSVISSVSGKSMQNSRLFVGCFGFGRSCYSIYGCFIYSDTFIAGLCQSFVLAARIHSTNLKGMLSLIQPFQNLPFGYFGTL